MQTVTQYEYLDRDKLLRGVVEWIVKESPIMKALPMQPVQGNSFKYNVEVTLPTASWLTVGDQIVESTGTYEQRSTDIYTMIQNSYTDKSKIALNATQNPETIDIELGAKAMAHEFETTFIRGQTSTLSNSKQFKGLMRILAEFESATTTDLDGSTDPGAGNNEQVLAVNAASGALTQAYMDALIDSIKPGKPDMLLMSRRSRRKLNTLARASGTSGLMLTDSELFGRKMRHYDEVPIYVSDFMPDNIQDGSASVLDIANFNPATTRASGYDNTMIFALQIGDEKVTGLQAGAMSHERETFVEDYNAICNRFIWYVGAACFRKYSLAALININPDS